MTYDQLEMLEAIVEQGTFKAASEFLHKSQPSLSTGIKKLEEEFGIVLFDRNDYRPKLTSQGKTFYRWAKESLDSFRSLSVVAKEMGQHQVESKLTVVIDPLVEYCDIHGVFQTCLTPQSPTELTLLSAILDNGKEMVLEEKADFAIGTLLTNDDKLESFPFRRTSLIPVAVEIIAHEYKKYPQVVVQSSSSQGGLTKGLKCYVSDHSMKYKLIQGGYGWGRLARHEIQQELDDKLLVEIKDPVVKEIDIDFYVIRHRHRPMGPVARKVWEELKKG